MNAIQLILTQHARVRRFLAQISPSKIHASLQKTFAKLVPYLISHETMEQKVCIRISRKIPSLNLLLLP